MTHLLLIDGDNLVRRYFHAHGSRPAEDAIGFALGRYRKMLAPSHALMIFDGDGPTWRHDLWPGYKAGRAEHPDGLDALFAAAAECCRGARLQAVEASADMEADDLIASYTQAAVDLGWQVSIVSGDKDLTQLLSDDPHVRMHDEIRKIVWGPSEVVKRFGVKPAWIPDLLALIGDTSDNYPGVPGIGAKTAVPLLLEFGGFAALMDRRTLVTRQSTFKRLMAHHETAMNCYRLACLRRDLELPIQIEALQWP